MEYILVKSLLIAILLGFAIGLQRTMSHIYSKDPERSAGSRTFALISLLGFLSAWLYKETPFTVTIIALSFFSLLVLSYYVKASLYKKMGMTTQIAAIITYLLGVMIYFHLEQYAVFIGILMIVLLELKPSLQRIERNITPTDINATILLLAMTFLILPILPDKMIGPYELFNPYKTWLMAVIIAAISFVGYVAIKILGNKQGVLLTGMFGGLISSTAVSISLSKMYALQKKYLNNFAAGITIACTLMYIRVVFEAIVINMEVAKHLFLPYGLATVSGFIYVYIIYKKATDTPPGIQNEILSKNPLQLSEAIKFGLLFGFIYGMITFVKEGYGDIGVYIVSFLSGITDVDAITLSLSQLQADNKLPVITSVYGIVIASIVNTYVKLGIVFWMGGRAIGVKVLWFTLLTTAMLGLGLWLESVPLVI
jgi:uncharacterized membrane protein (DUF4010 family)